MWEVHKSIYYFKSSRTKGHKSIKDNLTCLPRGKERQTNDGFFTFDEKHKESKIAFPECPKR